jgi:hypothetical protein
MGKPYTLREDYIIRNACEATWHQQRFSLPSDRGLSAYVVLQQIMSRAIDSIYSSTTTISGLRQDCDCASQCRAGIAAHQSVDMLIVRSAHEELRRWLTDVSANIASLKALLAGCDADGPWCIVDQATWVSPYNCKRFHT